MRWCSCGGERSCGGPGAGRCCSTVRSRTWGLVARTRPGGAGGGAGSRGSAGSERLAGQAREILLAEELGFADHAHLTRTVRAVTGHTPSACRDLL
ncbi:MAG: hypothetical protein ABSB59_38615 [Streptosporangiaceae bacterium]